MKVNNNNGLMNITDALINDFEGRGKDDRIDLPLISSYPSCMSDNKTESKASSTAINSVDKEEKNEKDMETTGENADMKSPHEDIYDLDEFDDWDTAGQLEGEREKDVSMEDTGLEANTDLTETVGIKSVTYDSKSVDDPNYSSPVTENKTEDNDGETTGLEASEVPGQAS
eukprot:CAMPEP_0182432072 /NCGR_PEP_ID=MMETSP1167-20130531/53817_1 /TAXON_ID=2988 /ORGANISM="Mallomonas Sp, Strain CCMP3275" /LENGTH=170 /DNA_ID=CAMNT_0024619149 /DNA_START=33 /DNA_END=541 /DNA_ORIENTATION=+